MSKKVMAAELYAKLVEEGVEEKLMRKTFIARAQQEPMNMTAAGASTYYVNAKNDAAGVAPKNYYKPASEKRQDNRVDDSKEQQPLWSIVTIEGMRKEGSTIHGTVDAVASFTSEEKALQRHSRLNSVNRAKAVVVVGSPNSGADVSGLTIIAS